MSLGHGPKIVQTALDFFIDPARLDVENRTGVSYTGKTAKIKNLVDNTYINLANENYVTGKTYYTLYGLTYPESSYGSRDGITPGINNTTAGKLYDCSRDLNYFVYDDVEGWLPTSWFNGERIDGHCYDTYDGQPAQHGTFQADFQSIHLNYPNATHIVIGSHAAERNDNDAATLAILQSIGLPDSHIGVARPEYILVGKVNKPSTWEYVRENVSSASATMNLGLPLSVSGAVGLNFDGGQLLNTGIYSGRNPATEPFTVEAWVKSDTTSGARMWIDATGNGSNQRFYSSLIHQSAGVPTGIQSSGWSTSVPYDTEWHHQVIVMDGSTAKLYSNGVEVGTKPYTSYTLAGPLVLGGRAGYYWDGQIGPVRVYGAVLTPADIKNNYEASRGRFQ